MRWWRRRGLRARVTLIAALGLLVALIAGDLLLLNTLRVSLTRSVDDSARSGATEVAYQPAGPEIASELEAFASAVRG